MSNNTERETVSIRLNPDLWKKAKIKAIKSDKTLGEYVEDLIKDDLS